MDPNLVWFILFNPLIAAALIHLVTRKSSGVSTFISVASSVFGLIAAIASLLLLTQAMRHLPAGTAYAVWTGIGGVGVAVLGIFVFGDSASPLRLLCIALIVAGIAGLRLLDA